MPELPDVDVYVEAIRRRAQDAVLRRASVRSPFVLRSVDPPLDAIEGNRVRGASRLGKRVVLHLEGDLHVVVHLMIAGRLRWFDPGVDSGVGKIELARFELSTGTLVLTEAGTRRRASLHVVAGIDRLRAHDPGGIEVEFATPEEFARALTRENRTLKRALTDPRVLAGIGNAYSDEILHAAGLSPLKLTRTLDESERERLRLACVRVLSEWRARLRRELGMEGTARGRFPGAGEVTAFRPGFAVHGKFDSPCPVCGVKVQRIVYAENETNYCPGCQTGGRVLADRSLSRLLRDDWPRDAEELE